MNFKQLSIVSAVAVGLTIPFAASANGGRSSGQYVNQNASIHGNGNTLNQSVHITNNYARFRPNHRHGQRARNGNRARHHNSRYNQKQRKIRKLKRKIRQLRRGGRNYNRWNRNQHHRNHYNRWSNGYGRNQIHFSITFRH